MPRWSSADHHPLQTLPPVRPRLTKGMGPWFRAPGMMTAWPQRPASP